MNWNGHLITKSSKGVINLFGANHILHLEIGVIVNSVWNRVSMPGEAQSFLPLEKSARRTYTSGTFLFGYRYLMGMTWIRIELKYTI